MLLKVAQNQDFVLSYVEGLGLMEAFACCC